ncbi:unnamed protein product [Owenia fusiformis]|uniref:Uncharacterized protein n=1 Tax=Owenia fusiformis TaxID=6347 RepID=A0A8J1XU57_OWEFU|nr:unnamed protein product [Owenia fusiformis]
MFSIPGIIHGDFHDENIIVQIQTIDKSNQVKAGSHSKVPNDGQVIKHAQFDVSESANDNTNTNDEQYVATGVIDFGDSFRSYFIFEVAIAICYLMIEVTLIDPVDVAGHFLAGYFTHMDLSARELDLLYICIHRAFAQEFVLGSLKYIDDPTNHYLVTSQRNGWKIMRNFWNISKSEVHFKWNCVLQKYNDDYVNLFKS